MPRHASSLVGGDIGVMVIDVALLGFNDLARSVILFTIISTPKMNNKSIWEVKIFQDFRSRDMESCHLAAVRRVELW